MPPLEPHSPTGPACERPDLATRLVEWDQLEASERRSVEQHAAGCASCAARLALFLQADAWLAQHGTGLAASRESALECPSAEDLYDYANGPGARPLSESLRASLDAHVDSCRLCSELVGTLASRPPAPLILEASGPGDEDAGSLPTPADLASPLAPARPRPTRRSAPRLVTALAAAAGLVAVLSVWRPWDGGGTQAAGGVFPERLLLRGELGDPLLFPRGALLAGQDGALVHELSFELTPQAGASFYRVELVRRAYEAFAAGQRVLELSGDTPRLTLDAEQARLVTPGRYTWEAWGLVNGLTVPLGRRDFEVRADAHTVEALGAAADDAQALELLVEGGYLGDARAWARAMPASPERDAWLELTPGR